MGNDKKKQILTIQQLAQNLATFAIDRRDLKELLAAIPENSAVNITTIEYELQLLKILSVGWAISFFMPASDKNKAALSEVFWENIREVAEKISTLTETTSGTKIDYFDILKERLNTYLKVLQNTQDDIENPAEIMGPAFAVACNAPNEAVAVLTGTKMFTLTLGAVKEYLAMIIIDDVKIN
jgi:hypothetical protein